MPALYIVDLAYAGTVVDGRFVTADPEQQGELDACLERLGWNATKRLRPID